MPELARRVRRVKELVTPVAKKGTMFVKERAAPKTFDFLRNRAAPKTKEIGAKTWALMRNSVGPKIMEISREKIVPGAKRAGATLAVYAARAGSKGAQIMQERGIPAMKSGAARTVEFLRKRRRPAMRRDEKVLAEEQAIRKKYGSGLAGTAAAVARMSGAKEIHGLRIAQAMVNAGYRPTQVKEMLERLRAEAVYHPSVRSRTEANRVAGFAILATHDAIKFGGAHPQVAYNAVMRMLRGADRQKIEQMTQVMKERMKSPAARTRVLQLLQPYVEQEMRAQAFLRKAEPPRVW